MITACFEKPEEDGSKETLVKTEMQTVPVLGTSYFILVRLTNGTKVQAFDKNENFWKVKVKSTGKTGYCSKNHLK